MEVKKIWKTKENSKKFKLKKIFWKKGESKFLSIRLHDKKLLTISQL